MGGSVPLGGADFSTSSGLPGGADFSTSSVLLVHGVESSSTTWWRVGDDLEDLGWTVLTVDLLAHGTREHTGHVPTVAELADDVLTTVGVDHVDLVVGHSLGAIVALELAAHAPGFADRIVLEDPPGLSGGLTTAQVAEETATNVARATADVGAEVARLLGENQRWAPIDALNAVSNRLALDLDVVLAFLWAADWDLQALVTACPVPLHLLAAKGPGSVLLEPDRSAVIAAIGADRCTEVESGHGVHRDRPAMWLQTVLAAAAS